MSGVEKGFDRRMDALASVLTQLNGEAAQWETMLRLRRDIQQRSREEILDTWIPRLRRDAQAWDAARRDAGVEGPDVTDALEGALGPKLSTLAAIHKGTQRRHAL